MRRVMYDIMLKQRIFVTAGCALALSLVPTAASAKPQPGNAPPQPTLGAAGGMRENSARASAARSRARRDQREAPPCYKPPVLITRQRGMEVEQRELSLLFCDGKPNPAALDSLSVLARSRDVERPALAEIRAYQRLPIDKGPAARRRNPAYLTRDVMRLHPGLVERLQRVAERFPGRTLELVSGHRPTARNTSRHHHGRALDFRVQGVTRERLRDFLRTFEQTGVGYYPNSTFVHMDVREDKGYWVDRSGPGEKADYGAWPPPPREIAQAQAQIVRGALADLAALGTTDLSGFRTVSMAQASSAPRARPKVPRAHSAPAEPQEDGDHMSPAEVARIRREALKALEALR